MVLYYLYCLTTEVFKMKFAKIATLVLACSLVACSSTKVSDGGPAGDITPINAQKLSTSFKRKGIKLEWECSWGTGGFGMTNSMCVKGDIKAVEVTAYAPSYGNSEVNRENAFRVAELNANRKLIEFLQKDVTSATVVKTLTKNVEKANDNIRSKITQNEVSVNDAEADSSTPDTNVATRTNVNETVRTVAESITSNSQRILKGVQVVDEQIIDRQTVQVTIRWDKDSRKAVQHLNNFMR